MADKFANLNDVKDYCRIDRGDATNDRILTLLNEGITKEIQTWLSRGITSTTYTDKFTPRDFQTKLMTSQYPIISHSGVTENDVTLTEGKDEGYTIDYDLGILTRGIADPSVLWYPQPYYWYPGIQEVEITYVAGFAIIPEDLQMVTIRKIYREFADRDVDDIKSRSGDGMGHTRFDLTEGMPPRDYSILKTYLRPFHGF